MRVGFLVWNQFQVAHFAEIAKQFDEPDFIFINRDLRAINNFNPAWLIDIGAYSRFFSELKLDKLDGEYDVILTQFRPPLKKPWSKTKLVMVQYSMAKPKTAYNERWFMADIGLIYGDYSEKIIGKMCPTAKIGNPRFDPYFEDKLNMDWLEEIKSQLNPDKKTILYLPTWGDLGTSSTFFEISSVLAQKYNLIYKPHHLSSLRDDEACCQNNDVITTDIFPKMLDITPFLYKVTDLVISDMSGAIFDALYCNKPVLIINDNNLNYENHSKADVKSLEIKERYSIGPLLNNSEGLNEKIVEDMLENPHSFKELNEKMVKRCFIQQGNCAKLAAEQITSFWQDSRNKKASNSFIEIELRDKLFEKAFNSAKKRHKKNNIEKKKHSNINLSKSKYIRKSMNASLRIVNIIASGLNRIGLEQGTRYMHNYAVNKLNDKNKSALWLAKDFEKEGMLSESACLYKKASNNSDLAKRKYLKLLISMELFYDIGYEVEGLCLKNPDNNFKNIYHYYNAVSTIRFSKVVWKNVLSVIYEESLSSDGGPNLKLLQDIGLIDTAMYITRKDGKIATKRLREAHSSLGDFSKIVEIAAKNEMLEFDKGICIDKYYNQIKMNNYINSGYVIEVFILLSLATGISDKDQRPYRESLLEFTQKVIDVILSLGFIIYPRIQAGIRGATLATGKYPCFTWHTINSGYDKQIHLKIGTLYGHFTIDNKGYSGWGSLANKDLKKIIKNINSKEADCHWQNLYSDLVEGGKSKYLQEKCEVEDWGNYIFFPMQVVDDTVAKLAYLDGLEILKVLSQWSKESSYNVVVKRHPMCKNKEVDDAIKKEERAGSILTSQANIHDLIAGADCVITVNSGVGAESLVHLKPVISTGKTDYAPASIKVKNVSELLTILNEKSWKYFTDEEIKKFLWFYTKRYMVQYQNNDDIKELTKSIFQSNKIKINKKTEVLSANDRKSMRIDKNYNVADILGNNCNLLLEKFYENDIGCWVDSGSLLGIIRNKNLNLWEKDIDLGIWATDYYKARKICKEISEEKDLLFREKWLFGAPYVIMLNKKGKGARKFLPIAVRLFYRNNDYAWSPHPHPLLWSKSKYPRYIYKKEIVANKSINKKLIYAYNNPKHGFAIGLSKLQVAPKINKFLHRQEMENNKDVPTHISEYKIGSLFYEYFQWVVPSMYFEKLQLFNEGMPHLLIPNNTEDYLTLRYGDWRLPVKQWVFLVDDLCLSPISKEKLKKTLTVVIKQVSF